MSAQPYRTGRWNESIWHHGNKHTLNCSKKLCFLPHLGVLQICSLNIMGLEIPLLPARKQRHQNSDKNVLVPGLQEFLSERESWWLVNNFTSFTLLQHTLGFGLWPLGAEGSPATCKTLVKPNLFSEGCCSLHRNPLAIQ